MTYTLSRFYSHKLQRETFFKCKNPPSPTRKMNPADCSAAEYRYHTITNIVITDIGIKIGHTICVKHQYSMDIS